jgi:hypothetical protein
MKTFIFAVLMTGLVIAGQTEAAPKWTSEDWKKYCQLDWDDSRSVSGQELQDAIEAFGVSSEDAKKAADHAEIMQRMDEANMVDMIAIPRNSWIEATSRKNMPYYMSRHDGPAQWTVILNDAWSPYGNYFPGH